MRQLSPAGKRRAMRVLYWSIVAALAAFTAYVYFQNPFEGGVTLCTFHALTCLLYTSRCV